MTSVRPRGLRRAIETGPRVFLRYPAPSDAAEYLALKRASRDFLRPWEATPVGGVSPFSPAAFERVVESRRTALSRRFLICRLEDGVIIGYIGLGGIAGGAFQSAFLGYWIGRAHARRGYMTEAVSLVLEHAFGSLGLHRVEANIIPRNAASRRVVRRLGFRYEGTARRYLRINHRWEDHQHWAMTVEEWGGLGGKRKTRRARR